MITSLPTERKVPGSISDSSELYSVESSHDVYELTVSGFYCLWFIFCPVLPSKYSQPSADYSQVGFPTVIMILCVLNRNLQSKALTCKSLVTLEAKCIDKLQ